LRVINVFIIIIIIIIILAFTSVSWLVSGRFRSFVCFQINK